MKIANFSITGDGSTTTEAGYIKTGDQADYTVDCPGGGSLNRRRGCIHRAEKG